MLRASLLRASIAPFLISSVSAMALAAQPSEEPTMSNHSVISTDKAPQAIGTYSQAIKAGATVYLSGQIPLVPDTMELVDGDMEAQLEQVFSNLTAVCEAAGGSLGKPAESGDGRAERERRLRAFKGFGPKTVQIFMREVPERWKQG